MEDITVVHTCGICEMIIDKINIPTHVCMEGYTRFFIDENFYFYPVTDDNKIIRRSLVNNEEIVLPVRENIPGTIKILSPINREISQEEKENRSLNKKDNRRSKCTLNYDDEELLILSVQERRPLWDFTVPLEQRSQRLTKKLWDEVSEILGGKLSGEEAKKKFKNLHDAYRRIIHSENHPSGSARPPLTKKWHHYDSMEFLRDLCLVKKGKASNIDIDDDSLSINTESVNNDPFGDNDQSESEASGIPIKRKKSSGQQSSALERIADSLCQPPTPFVIPTPPKPDEIDSALSVIGSRLRQMDRETQLDAVHQIMNLTYAILKRGN